MTGGMTGVAKIQFVKDWRKEMNTSLGDAIAVTYEMCGKTLAQACARAIIMMAQTTRKLTPQAKKRRTIEHDGRRQFYTAYRKGGTKRWYLPSRRRDPAAYAMARDKWGLIRNRGLAKRSWFWGLAGLRGAGDTGKRIPGMAELRVIKEKLRGGFHLLNKLPYVAKIMPTGYEQAAAQAASNRIMAQARSGLERHWKAVMERGAFRGQPGDRQPDLGKYLRQEAG
jgi:hypothetical protein